MVVQELICSGGESMDDQIRPLTSHLISLDHSCFVGKIRQIKGGKSQRKLTNVKRPYLKKKTNK